MSAKRGPKPKRKVPITWSNNFAYAIGLLASDGGLSGDGRHIVLTSVDIEQLENFLDALGIEVPIGTVKNNSPTQAYRVQMSDVVFYEFLLSIGLTPAKSKTIHRVKVPKEFFFDFLRGVFDGDGSIYSYWDPRWKASFMFYVEFASASEQFIQWIRATIEKYIGIKGHVSRGATRRCHQLRYAKREGIILIREMYTYKDAIALNRKRLKIAEILRIVGVHF